MEVLNLYRVAAGSYRREYVLVLTGVSEASSSIRHNVYAELPLIIGYLRWSGPRGVLAPPGPYFLLSTTFYSFFDHFQPIF